MRRSKELLNLRNAKIKELFNSSKKPATKTVKSLQKKFFVSERTIWEVIKDR